MDSDLTIANEWPSSRVVFRSDVGSPHASTTSPVNGTSTASAPRLQAIDNEPRCITIHRCILVVVDAQVIEPGVGQVGLVVPQRDQLA